MSGDDSKIVKFPQPEIAPEERARRLRVEMDRLEQRADLEGWQVKCLIASGGHLWMRNYFDRFPSVVRRRLAESAFNIFPACMGIEAHAAATSTQRNQALRWHLFPRDRGHRAKTKMRPPQRRI